ncbi:MAG: ATP-dependent DNA ligase [Actinomycetota bacterium]|nr:ATP-dependent DNA ligase [Actinomycetota bacterium]
MEPTVIPPLAPMLAKLARELPRGKAFLYEPKWDGFRCLVFRCRSEVDMWSRNQRPLTRYFPELLETFGSLEAERFVLDGEIMVLGPDGFDFVALLQRLHPAASRVARLRGETPACFVAFDLLAVDGDDLRRHPFQDRRPLLEKLLSPSGPPLFLTPLTEDHRLAQHWLQSFSGGGVDGVMAKHRGLPYQPGKRRMIKVKRQRTADCVVAGFRWHHQEPSVVSLLLGLYGRQGYLHHVGLATGFDAQRRRRLLVEIAPYAAPLEGHPWEHGFRDEGGPVGRLPGSASRWAEDGELTWVPLQPELVCEVNYDHVDGGRFRHAARFRGWRPDLQPGSCTFEQFAVAESSDVLDMLD